MKPSHLYASFSESCRIHPHKTAIFWEETEWKYHDLRLQAEAVAGRLTEGFQVKSGDRVAVWLKNCPEFVSVLFGILRCGAVAVPVNNFLKPDEVDYILGDAGIRVLISAASMGAGLGRLKEKRPNLSVLTVEELPARGCHFGREMGPEVQRASADMAVVIYTSGTTGHPKGAMLSHGNLLHNVDSCRVMLEAVDGDRFVLVLPMFHSFMLCVCILLPMVVGGSIILIKHVNLPRQIMAEVNRRQGTILPAIPQLFRALTHQTQSLDGLSLRVCLSGAAPLPLEILREFDEKFPIPLIEGYGLSEASPVVSLNPIRGTRKPGSIGLPIPNVEVSIQDDHGNLLADLENGEICVRGGNVMMGYWNRPDETARTIRDGWLLTGDIGYRDAEGYFYITDRKKDMLLVNGINVYPREIEEILYQFPGVKEAAVIGVPDVRKGEQPVAFLSVQEGSTVDEKAILHFVRERLADYKVPRSVHFLPSLPRTATGKILKTALRAQSKTANL